MFHSPSASRLRQGDEVSASSRLERDTKRLFTPGWWKYPVSWSKSLPGWTHRVDTCKTFHLRFVHFCAYKFYLNWKKGLLPLPNCLSPFRLLRKITGWVAYKQQKANSHSSRDWNSETRPREGPLQQCPHTVEEARISWEPLVQGH